jgi:hypothetical protein
MRRNDAVGAPQLRGATSEARGAVFFLGQTTRSGHGSCSRRGQGGKPRLCESAQRRKCQMALCKCCFGVKCPSHVYGGCCTTAPPRRAPFRESLLRSTVDIYILRGSPFDAQRDAHRARISRIVEKRAKKAPFGTFVAKGISRRFAELAENAR